MGDPGRGQGRGRNRPTRRAVWLCPRGRQHGGERPAGDQNQSRGSQHGGVLPTAARLPPYRPGVLEQVHRSRRGSGDPLALPSLGVFSLSFCDSLSYLLFALSFEFCGALAFLLFALSFAFCGALALLFGGRLALGGALPGLVRGTFPLLPRAFLLSGAFLFPSGGALALRSVPITLRGAVARPDMIRLRSAVRRRFAIRRHADAVGFGGRDRPGCGQARQWRRIVICV
jgi:hypothetical protein